MDGHDAGSPSLPLETAGTLIRAARERRGLSREVLFQETRIPVHVLEAIEQDDFERVQPALYARSFLRTLAVALELDPARVLALYEEGRRDAATASPPTWQTETRVERVGLLGPVWRRRLPWLLGGIGVAAVVLLLIGPRRRPPATTSPPVSAAAGSTAAGAGRTRSPTPDVPGRGETGEEGTALADSAPPPGTGAPRVLDTLRVERLLVPPDSAALRDAAVLPAGTPALVFAGGRRYPWVLRLLLARRVAVAVDTSAAGTPVPADWSRIGTPGVPHAGIVPGRVYAAGGRFVVYWGAAHCFLVHLGAADGVTLTLNGKPQTIPRRNVGRNWLLCEPAAGR